MSRYNALNADEIRTAVNTKYASNPEPKRAEMRAKYATYPEPKRMELRAIGMSPILSV